MTRRVADGCVERLVVNLEDLRPSGRSELDRSHESPDQKRLDEVMNFLAVRDPGERGVLPADEHAGMHHDVNEEATLTFCQTDGMAVRAWLAPWRPTLEMRRAGRVADSARTTLNFQSLQAATDRRQRITAQLASSLRSSADSLSAYFRTAASSSSVVGPAPTWRTR